MFGFTRDTNPSLHGERSLHDPPLKPDLQRRPPSRLSTMLHCAVAVVISSYRGWVYIGAILK